MSKKKGELRVAKGDAGVRRGFLQLQELDFPAELRRLVLTLHIVNCEVCCAPAYARHSKQGTIDDPSDCALLHRAAERLANADVPEQVLQALRLGRVVALRKPNGRVRALVVGDVFRRLVARALAQHFAGAFQEACLPYQFGLSTRAGTEGLYKLLHTATELDPRATVLSIDLVPLLPFARQFYGSASSCTWLDDNGGEHDVVQGEGGEQGDPLMPALYSLAEHAVLSEAAAGLREGEAIFAFLDDTYVVSAPERTGELHGALEDALWRHAHICLHQGKTRVWNAAGEEPSGFARLQPVGADPVWTGAWSLPADQRGLLVLRMLPPGATQAFAREHDTAVRACLAALLFQSTRHPLPARWPWVALGS